MPSLNIDIETPESFCDIDFERMTRYYGEPIDVITNLEGTVIPWGLSTKRAEVGSDVLMALREATLDQCIFGAHSITNRSGVKGGALNALFASTVENLGVPSLGEHPLNRAERKPSGIMSDRLVRRLRDDDKIWESKERQTANRLIIAFVGDKLSDMVEAEKLQEITEDVVVGFMVRRYGSTDHPLDKVFGKRRKATTSRQLLHAVAQNRFLR